MPGETEMLEIRKCISAKLWYTSLIVSRQTRGKSISSQCSNDTVDFVQSKALITNSIDSQNEEQHHWIVRTLWQELFNDVTSDVKCAEKEQSYAQMRHALQLCESLTIPLQQGLLEIYKNNLEQRHAESFERIQDECLLFLKQNIYNDPAVACWILNELLLSCSNASPEIVRDIQDFYFSVIKELLELKLSKQKSRRDDSFGRVLCVLSKMNITELNETLTKLFPTMLKAGGTRDIELALYSRNDEYFFREWCRFLNDISPHYKPVNSLSNALKIEKALFHSNSASAAVANKNKLVERVIKIKSHWVVDILDLCYTLIVNGKYDEVSAILSCKLLNAFWPALLFDALNNFSQEELLNDAEKDYDFIHNSIEALIPKCNFQAFGDAALTELQKLLERDVQIVKYILNYLRERNVKVEDSNGAKETEPFSNQQKISVKRIFDLLQRFDTLLALKTVTNIYDQDCEKIRGLLKDLREPENIFTAYCGTLNGLKAILSYDSCDSTRSAVATSFSDMDRYVTMLRPLDLRLRVMENIFSLLFLRHEDFDAGEKSYEKIDMDTSYEMQIDGNWMRQHLTGFVCNKYVVRDLLSHLTGLLSATEIEYIETRKNVNGCMDEADEIGKAIASLNAAIADAKWRLELYTTLEFSENANSKEETKIWPQLAFKSKAMSDEKLICNRSKESIFFYQESGMLEETKTRFNSSSESEPIYNTKWRRRSKSVGLAADGKDTVSHKPLFVNFMLATKESLIIRCLWKNDYAKAEDIIEASEMGNAQLNGEVQFSKALHAFRRSVSKQANTLESKDESPENLRSSTLENIRLVTQEGIQSSRQTGQFETFLASQEINLRTSAMEILNSNEILTICVLDLALTTSHVYPISLNLCEIAIKYLKLCKTFDNTEYVHFFQKFSQLLCEKKDKISVTDILCDAKISLSVKECKEREDLWSDITIKHQEFKETLANKVSKDSNYLPGLKILGKMATISWGTKKYMQNICSHLQLLHSIIPTNISNYYQLTVSDLLKIPLHYYFGYQIFELKVEPSKLEAIAYDLQVNLAYSILTNACPVISYEGNTSHAISNKNSGCIILNKASSKSDLSHKIGKPNQCVSEILADLLQTIRDIDSSKQHLTFDACKPMSDHPKIQSLLSKTSLFASLDLSELSMGAETLTFLLNTWNLMFLHATLIVWANNPPFNDLHHAISLTSIGYLIGDLGLVTLATLRSKLLNNVTLDDKFFTEVEELNELAWQDLDVTHDPRVFFLMANEYFGTPCIRVCKAESLDDDLTNAFREYLDFYSRETAAAQSGEKQRKVLLPQIVERYETCVSQHLETDPSSRNKFSINRYFESSDETVVVKYMPASYSFSVMFAYESHLNGQQQQKQINQYKIGWKHRNIRSSLLQYLEGQCWVVSYLFQRIHNENPTILENSCDNLKRAACLENLLTSTWAKELKLLFEDNETLAAILETIPVQKLWAHFEVTLKEKEDWETCLKLLNALPSCFASSTELQCFKDKVLSHIVSKAETAEVLPYLYQIKDVYTLSQTVLCNINKWHANVCLNALLHTTHHMDNCKLPVHCKLRLNEILHRILIFHKMLPYYAIKSNGTWYDVAYCTEKVDPLQIVKSLINADQFELCLEWMECQAFSLEMHPSVTEEFLIGLLKSESQNFKQTLKFLQALPLDQSIKLCKTVLKKLESIDPLRFVCNYLLEYCKATKTVKYRRTLLGIDILSMINVQERPLYIHLIKEPLLMLEQLLMNCKFESIQKILNAIEGKLDESDISKSSFDNTVRFYAKKLLDCRVSLQCETAESRSRSVQQSASEAENSEFVMPLVVPTKEEWVPNDKARKCSCCSTVIFSMFNRRHHCRRCGRVICATCSQHRMQVASYPTSILVRVCDDCKRQTEVQMHTSQGTPSTQSSEIFDYWRLTRDEKHNDTIREEFSFEYAPNISLCLTVLNLHFGYKTYTGFLLDCCDELKRLLQPVSGGKVNPEVDHSVIIKMIRSLLVAAKVKCAKLGLNTGLAHCDRFLSQVDLISSLVQSDCLNLIPSDNLGKRTLRKLRDHLIEEEQWTLALDVSTKAGLDTQGVWAMWGKACLKIGYFDEARDKFSHCLDKIQYENFDDWVILSYPRESDAASKRETPKLSDKTNESDEIKMDESSPKKSEFSKSRPLKDPLLVTEILQILDNLNAYRQYAHQYKSSENFASFKIAGQKQFLVRGTPVIVQNIYYQESLYYLLTYASYNSILEFFLKHEEFDKCLAFILENNLEPDLFFTVVYLPCLKHGHIEKLHETMVNKDASLLTWKRYLIHVCHNLEKRQYLNILYNLQLFMKDSVRAAMTCIRFYLTDVSNYKDLSAKATYLLDAQKHLESELQTETLNRRRRKSTSSMHSNQGILTMEMEPSEIDKHINTISRQMEITKFLANCEKEDRFPIHILNLFPGKDSNSSTALEVPTLFGNQQQKIDLAVLAILGGRNIEEGFGIAFRIMQDYNLPQQKVYSLAGHVLTMKNNISGVQQLIKCCHSSGIPNSYIMSDHALTHCVKILLNRLHDKDESTIKSDIHNLIKLISDIELKINAYIECKQLKAAYLLAAQHSRAQDIRKILKECDRLGQNAIKSICIKWLQQEPKR